MKRLESIVIAAAVSACAGSAAHIGSQDYYPGWSFFPFLIAGLIFVGVYIFLSWMRNPKGDNDGNRKN